MAFLFSASKTCFGFRKNDRVIALAAHAKAADISAAKFIENYGMIN
jgi:hypothetical protein